MEENILVSAKNLMSFLDKNRRSILELLMLEYNLSENDFDRLNILSDIKDFILSITGFSQNQPTSRYLDREECRGEYFLGNVVWMNRNIGNFYLRDIELSENMLVVGRTGTGKTTTVRRILYEWILKRKPALIFDWKGDYISLYNLFRDEEDFLKYFWVVDPGRGNFKFNPLRIPLNNDRLIVKPITWIEAFIDIFIHSFGLREASSSILMVALKNVYKKFNIDLYDRRFNETIFPRLIDLLEMVERYEPLSGFDRESQRSIIIRLRLLTQGLLGEMFNTYIGVRLEDIVKRFVIMNLKNIPLAVNKKFIIECMYGLIYEYVKAINDRSKTKFLFVIEEAHNVLSKHKPDLEKDILSKPEICLAELRDFGYGTIIVDQKPSELSPDAIANTSIKICHALDRNEDKETMVSAMSLKDYWLNELNKLDKGYALVKINREGVKECFMLKINPIFPSSTNFEEIFSYKYLDDRSLNFREKNVLKEYSELELNIIRLIGCSKACIY
ncbi:MAG TPA: ATP-binding protein, partial [Thermoprotei archaeon]|nr:ATP-binding protein [Thermoprotei archaeon]